MRIDDRARHPDPDLDAVALERDLLLRELDELDAQHAAGEIDHARYTRLNDELTARAAEAIAAARRGAAAAPPRRRALWRPLLVTAAIMLVATVAAVLLTDQLAPTVPPAPPVAADADEAARVARLAAVVDARPDDIPARMALARLMLQHQDFRAAQDQFDAVVRLDPWHAEALAYAGWLATLGGDADGGLARLGRAVAADDAYPDAHALRGLALMRAGDAPAAVDELHRYLALAPTGPLAADVGAVIARLGAQP